MPNESGFVRQSELEKVLKENAAVARFVLMFPTRSGLVPILEGLLQMKLHGVDQLAFSALNHHLVAAKIGRGEKLETGGYLIELQPVVLPDA